jgi:hypothetical protein
MWLAFSNYFRRDPDNVFSASLESLGAHVFEDRMHLARTASGNRLRRTRHHAYRRVVQNI